jgi:hypothetical protein
MGAEDGGRPLSIDTKSVATKLVPRNFIASAPPPSPSHATFHFSILNVVIEKVGRFAVTSFSGKWERKTLSSQQKLFFLFTSQVETDKNK